MIRFAAYLHPETFATSKEVTDDMFIGNSYPHFSNNRRNIAEILSHYPSLPLRKAEFSEFLKVHTPQYLDKLLLMANDQPLEEKPVLSIECVGLEYCLPGYCYGLGGMYEALDQMKAGKLDRAFCYALGGHHAFADKGHGYCLLNPLSVAVRYAQSLGFHHVLMIDWDIHHGDGTQAIFANDPTVYCISIHSVIDLYMMKVTSIEAGTTEYAKQIGQCNIPLLHRIFDAKFFAEIDLQGDFYRDNESIAAFQQSLENLPFLPDIIFVFAGCDSHKDDCGTDVTNWETRDFETLTKSVISLSRKANCPVLSSCCGGYNLKSTLDVVEAHVRTLASEE